MYSFSNEVGVGYGGFKWHLIYELEQELGDVYG